MIALIKTYLRIILTNKIIILFLTVIPLMILFFSYSTTVTQTEPSVVILENDNQKTSDIISKYLEKNSKVTVAKDETSYKVCLTSGNCNVGVKVLKDFDLNLNKDNISDYIALDSVTQDNYSIPVLFDLDTFFSYIIYNVKTSTTNDEIYQRFSVYIQNFDKYYQKAETKSTIDLTGYLLSSINFVAILIIIIIMNIFSKHKNHKIFDRISLLGVSKTNYTVSIVICLNVVLMLFLVLVNLYACKLLGLGSDVFKMTTNYYLVEMLFFNAILTIFINIFLRTKNANNFLAIIPIVLVPISMLGGYFWPFKIMPEYLQEIGYLLPTSWSNLYLQNQMGGVSMLYLGIFILVMSVFIGYNLYRKES